MGIGRRKIRRFAAGLGACVMLAGCGGSRPAGQEAPELIEPADAVEDNVFAQYRDIYSLEVIETYVLPYQEELSFARAGILEDVCVYIGQEVEEGEVLAQLRDDASAECERLMEQLARMREENAYNNRHFEIDIEIARLSGQDTARMELQLAQAKELQDFEENHLLDMLEKAEGERGGYQITAPFSGTVTAVAQYYNGMAVTENTPLLALAREDGRYLQTDYVSKEKIASCTEYYVMVDGKRYELEYIPRNDEELQAMAAKNEKSTSKYRMLNAQETALGGNAFLCIVKDYRENVLAVPKSALYKEHRNYYVYQIEGEKHIKTPVEVGVLGDVYAEIISGLTEGACVYVEK